MKKALIPILILALCSCEPVKERIAKNEVQEIYNVFWDELCADYVYLDGKDHEAIYLRGLDMLEEVSMENIKDALPCLDTMLYLLQDHQIVIRTAAGYNYYPIEPIFESSYYNTPLHQPYPSPDYNVAWIAHLDVADFFVLTKFADEKNYLYFRNSRNDWELPGIETFIDSVMQTEIRNGCEGIILDLRCSKEENEQNMVAMIKPFLPDKDTTIFYTEQRVSKKNPAKLGNKQPYIVHGRGSCMDVPVVVLFEKNTAGISNIFAHVLSDLPNVTTISTSETLGEGGLRKTVNLTNRQGKLVAIAKYPDRNTFNDHGSFNLPLQADIQVPYERVLPGTSQLELLKAMEVIDQNRNKNPKK